MTQPVSDGYTIPADWGAEAERLQLLADWRDPITLARMEALGLADGWRCLEVGVGSGSTARAMADRAGPEGAVVAADINAAFLEGLAGTPGVEPRCCDIRTEDFPAGAFDLVHTRLVLEHLADRVAVMKRMVDWLAPGGWVYFEEPDCAAALASPNPLWRRYMEAYLADPGYDFMIGRALPAEVGSLGLVEVGMELDTAVVAGGTKLARWYALTTEAVRPALLATGVVTGGDLDRINAALGEPGLLEPGMTMVGVWGRKAG